MENSVTFMDGTTFKIGDRVEFISLNGWHTGTVTGFRDTMRTSYIVINPDDLSQLDQEHVHPLNPVAAAQHGYPEWCEPRDRGLAGGCVRLAGIER